MKKKWIVLVLALLLTGCAQETQRKNTVIYIPAKPRQMVQNVTEPEITTATPRMEETVPEVTGAAKIQNSGTVKKSTGKTAGSGGSAQISSTEKPSDSKPSASKPSASKPQSSTITIPAETKPEETQPVSTEPPVTEAPETEPPLYDISGYAVGSLEFAMLDRINEYREEAGFGELSIDSYLCAIASCRSYEANLVWSHTRPDGRNCTTVLTDYGYWAEHAKELLAYGSGSGDGGAMVDKWMSSDSHRESLLSDASTVGIGIYRANGVTYATCLLVE